MIVSIPRPGDEGFNYPKTRGNMRHMAVHASIAHLLGGACIQIIAYRTKHQRYPLVHQRNINWVIMHESLHCIFQTLDLGMECQYGLDRMFPTIEDAKKRLSPRTKKGNRK